MAQRSRVVARATFAGLLGLACASPSTSSTARRPPDRTIPVDTSRVTPALRDSGGGVFIQLTGAPRPRVVEELRQAGLRPPPGRPEIRTYPGPGLNLVWGYINPGGVRRLAELQFVIMIEPSRGGEIIPMDAGAGSANRAT